MSEKKNYQVRAASRALQILTIFSTSRPELSLNEICEITKLNKSTLVRLLSVLEEEGFIEQGQENKKYSLGIKTFEIGSVYNLCHLKINHVARPFMEDLCRKVNLSTNLAILDKGDIVYIAIEEPNKIIRLNFSIGSRFGVYYTALGKVLISCLSEEAIQQQVEAKGGLKKKTEKTITNWEDLYQELRKVQEEGYALDDEEGIVGIRCIAAPVNDYSNRCVAALSISGMSVEITDERIPELVKELKHTTSSISERLGYAVIPT